MFAAVALMTLGLAAVACSVLAVVARFRDTAQRGSSSAITLHGRDAPLSPDDQQLLRAMIGTRSPDQAWDELDLRDLTGPGRRYR